MAADMAFNLAVAEESFKEGVFKRIVVRQRNLVEMVGVHELFAGRLRRTIFSRPHLFQGLIILICYKGHTERVKKIIWDYAASFYLA